MKPTLLAYSLRSASVAAAVLIFLPSPPAKALFDLKACQGLEQRYAQIARGASPIEINNLLFSAADKGCQALAVLVLDNGASLEARDLRIALFQPLTGFEIEQRFRGRNRQKHERRSRDRGRPD